jgi:hypothetical protein
VRSCEPAPKHGQPDADDEEPGDEREPRVDLLGDEEARQEERHEAEREHAGGVRDGNGRAEEERVPGAPAGAHEVAGDECLAVARCEGVRGTPERRDEQRDEDDTEGELAPLDQLLEAAADTGTSGRRSERRGRSRGRARHEAGGGRAHVERRREQLLRVGAELVRAALCRNGGGHEPRTFARPDGDLAPADPVRVGAVYERQHPPVDRCAVHGLEAKGRQAPRALPLRDAVRDRVERDADAVELELEPPGEHGRVAWRADAVTGLEGGDLGEIEHVMDEHAVARELDAGVVVDGEVAERVRAGAPGTGEGREPGDEHHRDEHPPLHASAFRTTGAQRTENPGLRASALRYHTRIAVRSPAHPAA